MDLPPESAAWRSPEPEKGAKPRFHRRQLPIVTQFPAGYWHPTLGREDEA